MTVKTTIDSTLNGQQAEFVLIEEGPHGHYATDRATLSGGTETFYFTELDGGRDKTYYPKVALETGDVTQTAQIPYGMEVSIDPIPHRDADAAGRVREDTYFEQGVGARELGLGTNELTKGLLTAALNDGEVLADDGYVYSSVQSAQDAASSWIFIGPGSFNESVTVDTPDINIHGSGYGSLIDGGTIGNAITINSANVTITDLSIQTTAGAGNTYYGVATDTNAESYTLDSITFRDGDEDAIRTDDANSCIFNNITIENGDDSGIVANTNNNIINNCNITGIAGTAITLGSATNGNIVSNCHLTSVGGTGICVATYDSIVIANRGYDFGDDGIFINGIDNIIANNRFNNASNQGIDDNGTNTILDANSTAGAT